MEELQMNLWTTVGLLVVVTVFVAVTAEWLVDSIDGLTDTGKISKEFVGIILLPIVGNAAGMFFPSFVYRAIHLITYWFFRARYCRDCFCQRQAYT